MLYGKVYWRVELSEIHRHRKKSLLLHMSVSFDVAKPYMYIWMPWNLIAQCTCVPYTDMYTYNFFSTVSEVLEGSLEDLIG